MMNKTTLRWVFIALAIVAPLLAAGMIYYQRNHFTCESHIIIVDEKYVLDVIADYAFNGNVGTYETSGDYIQQGQPNITVSNKIAFNYWREGNNLILISTETNERPKALQPYRLSIPDFFHFRERGIRLQVSSANASSYFFNYSNAPVFYCSKS